LVGPVELGGFFVLTVTSGFGTFRTSLLELMMSVHWVKADIAIASVAI
jgi:hypothetical protein